MSTWIYVAGVLAAIFALLKLLVRKSGCSCHSCGGRMNFWDELGDREQRDILAYFREYEKREPDTSSIFVCPACRYVYDDFSGEKMSLEGDNMSFCKVCGQRGVDYLGPYVRIGDMTVFQEANAGFLDKTECLSCRRNPLETADCILCDTDFKVTGCRRCKTLYGWVPLKESGFLYSVPLTEENILKKGPTGLAL